MRRSLSPDVLSMVSQHLRSLAQLDVLLFMRAHGSAPLMAGAVARELRMPLEQVVSCMADFLASGFLCQQPDGAYVYAPSPHDRARLDQVAVAFQEQRVSLIEAIFAVPNDIIQSFPAGAKTSKPS